MKLSIALLSSALFATTIFAAPSRTSAQRNEVRHQRRGGNLGTVTSSGASATVTSYNWGGAILSAPPPNTSFTAVSGSFVVPKPAPPTSGPGTWGGGAWVGIDGFANQLALLQAGVNWEVQVSAAGVPTYTYFAWYEWFPASWVNYTMDVTAGDEITVWCQSKSPSDGYCTITNGRTGITLTQEFGAEEPLFELTGQNAEWIVEDFADSFDTFGGIIPFANFGSVTFTNCEAIATNSTPAAYDPVYPTKDNTINQPMVQNGTYLTSLLFPGAKEVKVTYV